jgi:hypothetical protein
MAEETKRPSLWASVSGFLARHRFDVGLVVAVMALTLVSRILTMQPIENGGDPVLIALFAYGGYLSVETSVFFLPGIVVVMWLAHRSFKDCALACGILLAGFAVETVFMRSTGGESRLKAVAWRGIGSKTSSSYRPAASHRASASRYASGSEARARRRSRMRRAQRAFPP